ncbi:DUF1294 domain-containing protein [Pontiella sp.]|uniref:DUF1294 domain-containing protein n=1 Tax=Pontiella sp. TaxID=2837462 RepID=UPI0035663A4C
MQLQVQGKITKWDDEKGFGFITPRSGGAGVFVHINAFRHGARKRPQPGNIVYYSLSTDKQGRICAANVKLQGKHQYSPKRSGKKMAAFVFVALFFATLALLTFVLQRIPRFAIALYAVASLVTFVAYAIDKSAARHDRWRTPESTLHAMSLLGGWPGALLAQQALRHKSRKKEFRWVYIGTVLLNVAVTAWLVSPGGPETAQTFFDQLLKIFGR